VSIYNKEDRDDAPSLFDLKGPEYIILAIFVFATLALWVVLQ